MSTEVSKTEPMVTNNDEALRSIQSFDDAMQLLKESGVTPVDYSQEFGTGFEVLKGADEKATLVGVPFVILGIKFAPGDYDTDFAILHVVTQDGRKRVLIDGGTGICAQAKDMDARGIKSGVLVPKGLTRSDYEYVNDKGERKPATTFYLSA